MKTENFLKGRRGGQITDAERAALEGSLGPARRIEPRKTIVRRGELIEESTLLLKGFMCRYMDARDGQRQLVALHVPGDFLDLHGFPLRRLDHDVASIGEVEVAMVPHARLTAITEEFPHLARLMWFSTLLDAAQHREWIFRIGRLSALGRVAHFLSETHARLAAIGQARGGDFDLPLTQQDLAEACGLTNVHVNRTLARLRRDGVVTVTRQTVSIHNIARLAQLGEFDPDYLYFDDGVRTP